MNINIFTNNADETRKVGYDIASKMTGGEVICLYGDLGAGKTVFSGGFINYFLPEKRVVSPTFIIVRHYSVKKDAVTNIYHIDLYRMNSPLEIEGIGLSEFMNKPENIVIIEWAERLFDKKPKVRTDLSFEIIDENKRRILHNEYNK